MKSAQLLLMLVIALPQAGVVADSAAPTPLDEAVAAESPPGASFRIAPPEGHESADAYGQWARAEFDRLIARTVEVEQPPDRARLAPAARAALTGAAANHLLAHGLTPAATCKLLSLDLPNCGALPVDTGDDANAQQAIESLLTRAEELLATASEQLERHDEAAEPDDAGENARTAPELRRRLQTVNAFARALRAAFLEGPGGGNASRAAASALSPFRESAEPGVSAAAELWQAVLRSDEEDLVPALAILGAATVEPKPGTLPYAFFGKLLRCRLIARHESPAAALALLLQIEERCDTWFPRDARLQALRSCAVTRMQILREWAARLSGPEQQAQRQWCEDRIAELVADLPADAELLPLSPAIPLLMTAEDASFETDAAGPDDAPAEDNE